MIGCLCWNFIFEILDLILIQILYKGCKYIIDNTFNRNKNRNRINTSSSENADSSDPVVVVNPAGPLRPIKVEIVDDPC